MHYQSREIIAKYLVLRIAGSVIASRVCLTIKNLIFQKCRKYSTNKKLN